MKLLANHLTRSHGYVFLVMLVVAIGLTFWMSVSGLTPSMDHGRHVFDATLGAFTGPLTGSIHRGFQRSCTQFFITTIPYFGSVLLVGNLAQFLAAPDRWFVRVARMAAWILGWLAWFLGGFLSLLQALS